MIADFDIFNVTTFSQQLLSASVAYFDRSPSHTMSFADNEMFTIANNSVSVQENEFNLVRLVHSSTMDWLPRPTATDSIMKVSLLHTYAA
jgi:hypothetical protein